MEMQGYRLWLPPGMVTQGFLLAFHRWQVVELMFPLRMRWLFLLTLSSIVATAQLQMRVLTGIDSTQYPRLSVIVRCTDGGGPTTLEGGGVLIASSRYSILPERIETLNASEGTTRITWLADPRLNTEPICQIIAWKGTSVASDSVRLPRLPVLRILSQRREPLEEITLGSITPGTTKTITCFVQLHAGRYSTTGTGELPIRIDSIVSSNPLFQVTWLGWIGNPTPLPSPVYSPLPYELTISCTPPDTAYYSGTVTIYYDGGLSLPIPISCNRFYLPATQQLRIEFPRGGELFTPCTDVTIRWRGMAANAHVVLDYSLDSGRSWTEITTTRDSTARWTIPNTPTDKLLVRVRQLDGQQQIVRLSDQNPAPIGRLTFRADGRRLLAFHTINGETVEWDLASQQITWRAMPPDVGRIESVSVFYRDTSYALILYNAAGTGYGTLFRIGQSTPLWSGKVSSYPLRSAAMDTANSILAVLTVAGTMIELFRIEATALARVDAIPLPSIATAIAISGTTAYVALRTSRIRRYMLPDWSPTKELPLPTVPHIALLHPLSDGKRLAIGCMVSQPTLVQGFSAPVFVLDLPSEQIIRVDRRAASTPIAVTSSANARYLVVGFRGQPQSPLWDLAYDMVVGQATTHEGALGDVAFSPDQRYVASCSSSPPLELLVRTFLFPETAISSPLQIGAFALKQDTLRLSPIYAYTTADTILRARLCNSGNVPVVLSDHWIEGEPSFRLLTALQPDTIRPGECSDIALSFSPTRPGSYSGTLVVRHCQQLWRMPIHAVAVERHVRTPDTLDLGITCIGSTTRTQHVVLINDDPADLPIGAASIYDALRSPFRLVAPPRDTIIGGMSGLLLTIEFAPTQSGVTTGTLYVNYGWRDYTARIILRGIGIGGTLSPHVSPLPFIPEEPRRILRLRNTQAGMLTITDARIEPPGGFRLPATLPIAIPPGDSASIPVEWLQTDTTAAVLVLQIEPCGTALRIPLVRYRASATLRMPTVSADVRGRATIPLLLQWRSPYDYGDQLRCTLRVAMHPRLLMPDTTWIDNGQVRLLSVVRQEDRRIATIEVVRSLRSGEDTLAFIGGLAALGEQDTSQLTFADAPYWGSAVAVNTLPGTLQLEGFCGDRRTYPDSRTAMIIYPSPTSDETVTVAIESAVAFAGVLEVYTWRGEHRIRQPLTVQQGTTTVLLPIATLETGTYVAVLDSPSNDAIKPNHVVFVVVR